MKLKLLFSTIALMIGSLAYTQVTDQSSSSLQSEEELHKPTNDSPFMETVNTRANGDDCTDPIIISLPTALPYTDANQTNCSRVNTYSSTCLGYYDDGEDIIYRLDVTTDVIIDITLDPHTTTYTGILIDDACPGEDPCMDYSTNNSASPHGFSLVSLTAAGSPYYIMVDTWPSPNCIPDFDLTIVEITCPDPSAQTETNITDISAELGWTTGGASTWNIEWGPTGFTQGSGTLVTGITVNPHLLSGLSASTTYDWYVRDDCGGSDYSAWVGPNTFSTTQTPAPVQSLPFTEDWETGPPIGPVWNYYTGSVSTIEINTASVYNGTYGLEQYGDEFGNYVYPSDIEDAYTKAQPGGVNEDWTSWNQISVDLTGATSPWLNFWYAMGNKSYFWVQVSTDATSWTDLFATQTDNASIPFEMKEVNLSTYNGTSQLYIRFFHNGRFDSDYLWLDDIAVEEISCQSPIDQTANNIIDDVADLAWTSRGSESLWDIELGISGFTPTGTPTASGVSNSYSYGGLSGSTTYDWYVRADCTGGDESEWVGPNTFTTLQIPAPVQSLPFLEDWETGTISSSIWNIHAGALSTIEANTNSNYNSAYGLEQYGNKYQSGYVPPTDLSDAYAKAQPGGENEDYTTWNQFSVDLTSATSPWLIFSYAMGYFSDYNYNNFWVQVSTDYIAWTDLYATQTNGSDIPYETQDFDLSAYNGTSQLFIRFFHNGKTNGNYLWLDDIAVEEVSCPSPAGLITTNIMADEADLGWTSRGTEASWDIEWGTSPYTFTGTPTITGVSNPYNLTGLTSNTEYTWRVSADCSGGDQSIWKGPNTFTTLCDAISPPYFLDFDDVTDPHMPICIIVENTNNDNSIWETEEYYSDGSPNEAEIIKTSEQMDDWFFTNGIALSGGTTYIIEFYNHASSGTGKLAVDWGYYPTSSSMSGTPIFDDNISNTSYILTSEEFTPGTSTTYYFGFHGYSDAGIGSLHIDEIAILKKVEDATWNGSTDNDWKNNSNWNEGVPYSMSDVTIPSDLSYYPTVDDVAAVNNLIIQSNASLVGIDYLIVNGTATVERSIDGYTGDGDGFHFLSSPVSSLLIAGSDFEPASGIDDLYAWDELANIWRNYHGGNFPDAEFEVGKGYLVAYNSENLGSFTGNMNATIVYNTLTYTAGEGEGWNLLGNPYPSAIDWDELYRASGIDGSVYVLRGSDNTYLSWNSSSHTGDLTDGHIPINNGFFAKTVLNNKTLTIRPEDQVHGNSGFLKDATEDMPENTLKVTISNGDFVNNAYIQFRTDASLEFDNAIDAYKLFGTGVGPQLFTKYAEIDYSINCVPFTSGQYDMNMGFITKTSGTHIISASGVNTFQDNNFSVYLEDIMTGDLTDLSKTTYTFIAETEGNENRFLLHFYDITNIFEAPAVEIVQVYTSRNKVYIRFDQLPQYVSHVGVYNTYGQQVYSGKLIPATLSTIQLNEKPGIYIIKLQTENGFKTQKVIIQ